MTDDPIVSIRPPAPGLVAPPAAPPAPPPDDEHMHEPLHVRVFAAAVSSLSQQLDGYRPQPGRYGLVNAATALDLAAAALRVAEQLARPHDAGETPPAPAEVAALLHKLGDVHDRAGEVHIAVLGQLGVMHRAATGHAIVGPPGSDPTAEVESVARTAIDADRSNGAAGDATQRAATRLRRLTRPGDPPGR